jgi:hypothetical protein
MAFSGSPVLFYDVPVGGIWGKLGFGVPNFGNRLVSRNIVILELVEVIGRNLQAIMLSDDAMSRTPPSINTIKEINKLVMRARQLLGTEQVMDNQDRMVGMHGQNDKQAFLIFPTPIFEVRNRWMKTYAYYVMHALAEAIQSTENATSPFEITNIFAGQVGQYFVRILKRMACELLMINPQDKTVPVLTNGLPNWGAFTLSDAQINAYSPSTWFSPTELIDTVYPTGDIPDTIALEFLTNGIPSVDLPKLGAYPVTIFDTEADNNPDPSTLAQGTGATNPPATGGAAAVAGTTSVAFAPPPGAAK